MSEQLQVASPSLHSKTIQTKSNSYFFDVKAAKNGNKYLIITESRIKDGQKYRNSVMVFSNNLQQFAEGFAEMADKIKA